MKINKNFVLRNVVNTWVILPLSDKTVDFNDMITLNESGVLLWKALENGADTDALVAALLGEYIVSEQEARADVDVFLGKLRTIGCLED